jgi:pimeloyl-ACP methyl ester carboxylesterase
MILKLTAYAIIGYAVLVVLACTFQRRLLYFPDRGKPSNEQLSARGLKYWPTEDGFKGLLSLNTSPPTNGTVIVFHGNAGSAWHRDYYAHALEPLGYRVLLAEYPGYGGRPGKMSEESFVIDAKKIISSARSLFGDPIYLIGESMGCGVAAAAAAAAAETTNALSGLVLVTPWDSLPRLAQTHYWYLPARWLVRDQYDSIQNLRMFKRPIALAMAEHDKIIPNKHTLNLYDALSGPKKLWKFDNAGHNSWPTAPGEQWWKEVMDFVSSQ